MSEQDRPWAGRRLHFVGAGGSGMSGYVRAAHALGASVSGSDRSDSPYLEQLRAESVLDARIGHDAANLPDGEDVELVYSSAVAADNPERVAARRRGLPERPRAGLLAQLSALRRTIAVAGTHGKTTTSAMIVHALRGAGMDPGWLIGAPIGGGLPNSHWSESEWLVIEADESDRSMLSLKVEIAVLTNAELDHHAAFGSLGDLLEAFGAFLAGAPKAAIWDRPQLLALRDALCVAYDAPAPVLAPGGSTFEWRGISVRLSVPGAHNAVNAAGALEAAALAGARPAAAARALAGFRGAGRRFERLGRSERGALIVSDYAHHPTEVAATIAAARSERPGRLVAVFQPHLYSRTQLLAREFGQALSRADVIVLLDVYPARERPEDHPGVSGLTLARAAAEAAAGRPVLWLPDRQRAQAALVAMLDPEDVCLVMGAGDVDGLARSLATMPLARVQRGRSLRRLCTVRTGGPAEWFARVGDELELVDLLGWSRRRGLQLSVLGSGSNLLVADEGVCGLVVKLDGQLARIDRDGTALRCGGGARLPAVAAAAARAGLSGIEFGVNIPGTVGGAVRMNANAYGGRLADWLEWVRVATADGVSVRGPDQLGFGYRRSALGSGEVVVAASFSLEQSEPARVRARLEQMRSARHEAQPQGIRTFGSTFKNPEDPRVNGTSAGMLLSEAGCNGLQVGGARFSLKHANFVENTGEASTAEIVSLMAEGRRRVLERFGVELEPEVQTLGPVRFPWRG